MAILKIVGTDYPSIPSYQQYNCYVTMYAETNITSVSVPIKLADINSDTGEYYDESVRIAIVDMNYNILVEDTFNFNGTGYRVVTLDANVVISERQRIRILADCKYCTVNKYDVGTNYAIEGGQAVMDGSYNGYEMDIYCNQEKVWKNTDDNAGYPYFADVDESIFDGYQHPKPLNSWKIDGNNAGYPWTWGFSDLAGQVIFLKQNGFLYPQTLFLKQNGKIIPLFFIKKK